MKTNKQPVSHSIAFLAAVFLALSIFLSRPASFETIIWKFPRWVDLDEEDSTVTVEEIKTLLANYQQFSTQEEKDTLETVPNVAPAKEADSLHSDILLPVEAVLLGDELYGREDAANVLHPDLLLQGNERAFERLASFFSKLNAPLRSPSLHVFHFGDSQIEGDRITGVLRSKWQETWGGSGPGFLAPAQPIPSLSMKQEWSGDWNRFTRFGKVDSTIEHNRYGMFAAFAQHENNKGEISPWIRFTPHPRSFKRNQVFDQIHLVLGRTGPASSVTLELNNDTLQSIQLEIDSLHSTVVIPIPPDSAAVRSFESLKISFEGSSPEFHAIGLWSKSGIVVHNAAMRGSSGTLFRQLDRAQLTAQLRSVRTEMIMLQYGGNAVPYLKDSASIRRFGGWFASQIRLFQAILPEVPILVIGPSDMCEKSGTRMQTYPMLPYVRDVMKSITMQENALYWDVFEVMGGSGSMAAWVESSPPLASSDHVHFTPQGAREIANLFNKSLQTEWALWQAWQADLTLSDGL